MTEHITIDVSGAGAVAHGTSRGSDGAKLLKDQGWRWARSLGAWCLPRSYRDETVRQYVRWTTGALDTAGITYSVEGWDDRETEEEREARRIERDRELVGIHEHRAERHAAESDARYAASKAISDMIPMGQPILVGHHSERRHRRDLAKIHRDMGKSVEAQREAEHEARKAREAAARVSLAERKHEPPAIGPDDVSKGDHVRWRGQWFEVKRVNRKTVTVPHILGPLADAGYTYTLPYKELVGHTRKP